MPEEKIKKIADSADMVVGGYAFTKKDGIISVLNINNPEYAMVLSIEGKLLETNMEPIEQAPMACAIAGDAAFAINPREPPMIILTPTACAPGTKHRAIPPTNCKPEINQLHQGAFPVGSTQFTGVLKQ